ncbi:MAG: hypothetical protein FWC65_06195 [Treponema sp.]|nr:hypothetical protein [Treponema sp.]
MMKNIKGTRKYAALVLVALLGAFFAACENPIIETWWQENQTVCRRSDPSDPNIRIRSIQIAIFAGNQIHYNRLSPLDNYGNPISNPSVGSWLTVADQNFNNAGLFAVAQLLYDNPTFRVLLQGHANPTGLANEDEELNRISHARAADTAEFLVRAYAIVCNPALESSWHDPNYAGIPSPDPVIPYMSGARTALDPRMTVEGYGGNFAFVQPGGAQGDYPYFNRRVNITIYTIVY